MLPLEQFWLAFHSSEKLKETFQTLRIARFKVTRSQRFPGCLIMLRPAILHGKNCRCSLPGNFVCTLYFEVFRLRSCESIIYHISCGISYSEVFQHTSCGRMIYRISCGTFHSQVFQHTSCESMIYHISCRVS